MAATSGESSAAELRGRLEAAEKLATEKESAHRLEAERLKSAAAADAVKLAELEQKLGTQLAQADDLSASKAAADRQAADLVSIAPP